MTYVIAMERGLGGNGYAVPSRAGIWRTISCTSKYSRASMSGVGRLHARLDIILAHLIHRITTLNRSRKQETTCVLRELASSFDSDLSIER